MRLISGRSIILRVGQTIGFTPTPRLKLLAKHKVPQVKHGAGGIAERKGRFMVVGGLPEGVPENYVYEYDKNFKFKRHVIKSGWTRLGIQAATFAQGWFACYGGVLLKVTPEFDVGKYNLIADMVCCPGRITNNCTVLTASPWTAVGMGMLRLCQ